MPQGVLARLSPRGKKIPLRPPTGLDEFMNPGRVPGESGQEFAHFSNNNTHICCCYVCAVFSVREFVTDIKFPVFPRPDRRILWSKFVLWSGENGYCNFDIARTTLEEVARSVRLADGILWWFLVTWHLRYGCFTRVGDLLWMESDNVTNDLLKLVI